MQQLVKPAASTCCCFIGLDCYGRLGSESVDVCCGNAAGATYLFLVLYRSVLVCVLHAELPYAVVCVLMCV